MDQVRMFSDFLIRRGLKTTSQRKVILKSFLNSPSHCSTEDLYLKIRRDNPRIGYATVHRTLKLLVECGVAIEQNFGDGHARFEPVRTGNHHDHLVCLECGLINEFKESQIEELQKQVAATYQFTIKNHRHELYGVCFCCSQK